MNVTVKNSTWQEADGWLFIYKVWSSIWTRDFRVLGTFEFRGDACVDLHGPES